MPNEPALMKNIARRELSTKWGLLPDDLPDPDENLSLNKVFSKPTDDEIACLMWQYPDARDHQAIEAFHPTFQHLPTDTNKVAGILFLVYFPEENYERASYSVFNLRRSKKDLMADWEENLDRWLGDRKKAGLTQEVPQRRHRLQESKKYLKAYDLRKQNHLYKEIDLQIFPEFGRDEKRGRTYCRKGEALVMNPPLLPPPRSRT